MQKLKKGFFLKASAFIIALALVAGLVIEKSSFASGIFPGGALVTDNGSDQFFGNYCFPLI